MLAGLYNHTQTMLFVLASALSLLPSHAPVSSRAVVFRSRIDAPVMALDRRGALMAAAAAIIAAPPLKAVAIAGFNDDGSIAGTKKSAAPAKVPAAKPAPVKTTAKAATTSKPSSGTKAPAKKPPAAKSKAQTDSDRKVAAAKAKIGAKEKAAQGLKDRQKAKALAEQNKRLAETKKKADVREAKRVGLVKKQNIKKAAEKRRKKGKGNPLVTLLGVGAVGFGGLVLLGSVDDKPAAPAAAPETDSPEEA